MSAPHASPPRPGFAPWQFGLLLALLIAAMFPEILFAGQTFLARDFGFFACPAAQFQRDCFWRGELPCWDPYNNCGTPFLAQWNTLPLYPPALLYLCLPLAWGLSCFSLLHLWWAGLGMYFLARRWTGNPFAAAFAGLAFTFNGFTLNLLMWPSHMATLAWLPWVILAAESAWREGGRKVFIAAFVGAAQMLAGGPEIIFVTWLLALALWIQALVRADTARTWLFWRLPLIVALVFTLSAIQLLPFLDLVAHAQRATGYTDLRWSVPGSGLANFLVPMAFGSTAAEGIFFQHGQYWTSSYYLGLGPLWLALLGAVWARDSRGRLLAIASVVAWLCAWGEHTPFYPLLRHLVPQLSFITYPVKFVMVPVFAAPLLAAFALGALDRLQKQLLLFGGILLTGIAAIVVWTQLASTPGDDAHAALLNGLTRAVFLGLTGAALFALSRDGVSPWFRFAPVALLVIAWLDVFTHMPKQNPTASPDVFALNLARNRLAMDPQPELGKSRAMLSPAAALELTRFAISNPQNNLLAKRLGYCANANLLDAVPKVDGFFSLTPRDFDTLLSLRYTATNGNWTGLENFLGVSEYTSATNALAWEPRRGFLPLITAGQKPVFLDDTNTLWAFGRNEFDPARTVCLPPEARPFVTASNIATVAVTNAKFGVDTVSFQVQAPAPTLAVIAQAYYHNWRAEIDGQPAPLLRANLAFQAVPIPAGTHQIRLEYEDRAFEIGAIISICMWVNCFVCYLVWRRRDLLPAARAKDDHDP